MKYVLAGPSAKCATAKLLSNDLSKPTDDAAAYYRC
jgi:hypothetical protein